ncbi:hypothetical protein [Acutalibacter sp. 1XD8-36]|uniref:hypothetical protein n=1 Tax=Acutalibacter sp. 1XD8-36 TaxID=2320852 RepID=UPI001413511F|nr:hypothetical protein [Acutalibacter sp. 1XD8-36]NBJ88358.1 hypothetical protein [Acutalibacter sp. 1XD8-36]
MTLTKSLDKRGGFTSVFIWQLRRILPAAVIYWLLMAGVTLWDSIVRRGVEDHVHLMEIFITGFAFYMPIMCLGDCFSRRQADYINALPVPRGELYLASVLNGLWQILLPIIPCRLFTAWMSSYGLGGYHIRSLTTVAIALVGFSFMMAALSGTYHGYIMASAAHLICWRVIVFSSMALVDHTIPRVYSYGNSMDFFQILFSPVGVEFQHPDGFTRTAIFIWLPILGALCGYAGYHLYKRRKSEWAGHFGQCVLLERVLRTELTLGAGLLTVSILAGSSNYWRVGGLGIPITLGGMVLAMVVVFLILELVWHRRLKALLSHAISIGISGAMMLGGIILVSTGLGLDTDIPEVSEIENVSMNFHYPVNVIDMNGYWGAEPIEPRPVIRTEISEGEVIDELAPFSLTDCLWSPEMLDKVHELNKKYIELERAAQYPYLPGRLAYRNQEEIFISYHVTNHDPDGMPSYKNVSVCYRGPVNSKTEPILEEIRNLRREIIKSDEFVYSQMPLNAIDAVKTVSRLKPKGEFYTGLTVTESDISAIKDYKGLDELPKDFLTRLEEAMSEDFRNGRFTTYDGVLEADYQIYQLGYGGEFTARGGLAIDNGEYKPAKGMKLKLHEYDYNDSTFLPNVLRVTKEMPATYGYLETLYS